MEGKIYICECGKEFISPNSFNGHKSQCRIHLGEEKYTIRQSQNKLKWKEASKISNNNKKYPIIEKQCLRCGNKFLGTNKKGATKYCSRSCANKGRNQKAKTNKKYHFYGGWYNNIHFDSSWELAYYVYMIEHNEIIERNERYFTYIKDNQYHKYYPDFYLPQYNIYIEIKGYEKDLDLIKYSTLDNLKIIKEKDIKTYIDYCKSKYGKLFWITLYS